MAIEITPHPPWIQEFLRLMSSFMDRIVNGDYFGQVAAGTLSMTIFRGGLINFYPLVENFPAYMGRAIEKVPAGKSPRNDMARDWLMENINIERRHTLWFRQWAIDFGVPEETFHTAIVPPPGMDAINNFLWRTVDQGTLAECIAAVNFGIEGATSEWTKSVKRNIRAYEGQEGVTFRKGTMFWIKAHAAYDDKHTPESLELIKAFATTDHEREKVIQAAQRSLEYYAMAAEACYEIFK